MRCSPRRVNPGLGILVNRAGISHQAKLEEMTRDDYDAVMDTNLKGAFFTARAAARQMMAHRIEGRIVNIAPATIAVDDDFTSF